MKQSQVDRIKKLLAQSNVQKKSIVTEMKNSFLEYAMSVIVSRALPDARDGLKPVHRRILYAMNELGMTSDKPFKKSARIVGEVIGKYHPHGDAAVYETMVRMAQDFSTRYMLVEGHGNFGSIDGDSAAAMRYTEARLSKISGELLKDINMKTVDFRPNYDGSETEPVVLPARFPNLLVNGATGIAVGMATNIPTHNLGEIIDGILHLAQNPDASIEDLMQFVHGPDFPTGATIIGDKGIESAYKTGKGIVITRSKTHIEREEDTKKAKIIISEIPYQVNKANLIEKIADLAKDKIIDGISDIRDESNMKGIRVVIETKRDAIPEIVLNKLYKLTSLQTSFGINMLALINGAPQVINLKQSLQAYINHQTTVTHRKAEHELVRAKERAHILEGLKVALENVDDVIKLIRAEKTPADAQAKLRANYGLSEEQTKAIVDMRLARLTGLEMGKIIEEVKDLHTKINDLNDILDRKERVIDIICENLRVVRDKYADDRRTIIAHGMSADIDEESLIPEEQVVISLSTKGYIKRLPIDTYRQQNRGGVGVAGMATNKGDDVGYMLTCNTHTDLVFFTDYGKAYRIRAHEVPEFARQHKGLPLVNLLNVEKDEQVRAAISVDDYSEGYLFFTTLDGIVKRTPLSEFSSIRQNGKIAITLKEGDHLFDVKKTTGDNEVIIGASHGKVARFHETHVRSMGRTAAGVIGLAIDPGKGKVVGVSTDQQGRYVLTIGTRGYGKITPIEEFRLTKRGAKGVIGHNLSKKTGELICATLVSGEEDLLVITAKGTVIRTKIDQVRHSKRDTVGVTLIKVKDKDHVMATSVFTPEKESIQEYDASGNPLIMDDFGN